MGGFLIFIAICVIINLISNNSKSSSSSNSGWQPSHRPQSNMGTFEIRAKHDMRGENKDLKAIAIEGRGHLPVPRFMNIEFVTWAEDVTDNQSGDPIFCSIDSYQHHENPTFQCVRDAGTISPNQGFTDWVELGVAPLDALSFPKSGTRIIKFYCYMTEKTSPNLRQSLVGDYCRITISNDSIGYKEWKDKRIEALTLSLRLGVAMAHSDGDFAKSEAAVIKKWLKERIEKLDDDEQKEAKEKLNAILIEAVNQASIGRLNVDIATDNLKKSPIKNAQYDALQLCTIIMAADGVIHQEEIILLKKIGSKLGISANEMRGLADKHTASATTQSASGALTDEMLVGLDTSQSAPEIKVQIISIFNRYNGLLTIEKDPVKRKRYQEFINAVARLKKKYG